MAAPVGDAGIDGRTTKSGYLVYKSEEDYRENVVIAIVFGKLSKKMFVLPQYAAVYWVTSSRLLRLIATS